jgi:hypothetical protein
MIWEMRMKFVIRDEHGTRLPGSYSYDMGCRIAHFWRERGFEVFLVDLSTQRAVSEVCEINADLDNFARKIVSDFWNSDFESKLI